VGARVGEREEMFLDTRHINEVWTSSCPKCLRPGWYRALKIAGSYYLYIYHGRKQSRPDRCYLCPLEDLPNRHLSEFKA